MVANAYLGHLCPFKDSLSNLVVVKLLHGWQDGKGGALQRSGNAMRGVEVAVGVRDAQHCGGEDVDRLTDGEGVGRDVGERLKAGMCGVHLREIADRSLQCTLAPSLKRPMACRHNGSTYITTKYGIVPEIPAFEQDAFAGYA